MGGQQTFLLSPFQLLQFVEIWIPISEGLERNHIWWKDEVKDQGPKGTARISCPCPATALGCRTAPPAQLISPGPSAPAAVTPQQGWRPVHPSPALPGLGHDNLGSHPGLALVHPCPHGGSNACSWNTAPGCCWPLLHPDTMSRSSACTFHVADESLKHWGAARPNF